MTRTLPFFDRLLDYGRSLQRLGQTAKAGQHFAHLLRFPNLPAEIAEEVHFRLAEMHLSAERYKKARRHMSIALTYQPEYAAYHYLMAAAIEDDEQCDPRRALKHLHQAAELDPDNADYQLDYGLAALRLGKRQTGLRALRQVVKLAPDDPEMLESVCEGLRQANKEDEAKTLLRAALFRNPHDGRFRVAWERFQFQLLRAQQQDERRPAPTIADAHAILPFVRPVPAPAQGDRSLRHDAPATTPGPHWPRSPRKARSKKAR
ncbi:MAG: tetratricopeptide repeat protein [Gemmataceae bacterium]|nr:tetratricopeptide repeat protein [Gemmataceae bacterium]MCI0740503.1 tetratricopeptide repeat protein [Gemmataceae bacterium]